MLLIGVARDGQRRWARPSTNPAMDEQEGTLAGDNTLLVLFGDEPRLERWLDRFAALAASVADAIPLSVTPAFAEQRRIPTEAPR